MSRALKLFLSIGPLFILIAVISFLWPAYVVREDLRKTEFLFSQEAVKEQIQLAQARTTTFTNKINQALASIHSALLYIDESSSVQAAIQTSAVDGALWQEAAQTLSYNPQIGFFQILQDGKSLATIAPQNASALGAKLTKLNDSVSVVMVDTTVGTLEPYIGIRLPDSLNDPLEPYFLYPITYFFPGADIDDPALEQKLVDFAAAFQKLGLHETKALIAAFAKQYKRSNVKLQASRQQGLQGKSLLQFYEGENAEFLAIQTRMFVHALLDGIEHSPFEEGAPYGLASFDPNPEATFNGIALLSSDIFFDHALFDARHQLQTYPPTNPELPVSSNYSLLDENELKQLFLTLSLEMKGGFLITLGSSITPILADLALNTEAIALLTEKGRVHVAVNSEGVSLPQVLFENVSLDPYLSLPHGLITYENQIYQFMQIAPFGGSPVHVFLLRLQNLDPIYVLQQMISGKLNSTSQLLAFQLLGINVIILLAALVILLILTRTVTRPLRHLALVTEEIAKGNYSVEIPQVPDGRDEVGILAKGFGRMIQALKDKEQMRSVLNKVVSKEIAADLLKGKVALGGEMRNAAVLFADIRGFTKMSENLDPEKLIMILNKYMTKMSHVIEEHKGVIDKYVGDEIMALFGAPIDDPEGPKRAIEAAIDMIVELKKFNIERQAEGHVELQIGVGINSGKMVAGNMGAEDRLNYTVLGANVNKAARLCSAAGLMQILVSEETLNASGLKERLHIEEVPPITLKGFTEPVKVYSVIGYKT